MDKEAFLHQLESAVTNNDKKSFTKIIYDLPADVVVGFTKEEFLRVIYSSHQFSTQKMDRLYNFLENKGQISLKAALNGVDELNNCLLSKFYYSLYISLSENNKEKIIRVLIKNTVACGKLAEMGIDCKENFETVVSLCSKARQIYPPKSADYAGALMNEGIARSKLADLDVDSKENLEVAISHYTNSRKIFSEISPEDYARTLMNEGVARQTLAEKGIKCRENLETAITLYVNSRENFPKISVDYASALMNEGSARKILADMDIDCRDNLETAISLYVNSRENFPKTSASYARALMNEGVARKKLAEMNINSQENFSRSKELYFASILILEKLGDGLTYPIALLNLNNLLKDNYYRTGDVQYLEEWGNYLGDIEKKIENRDIKYKDRLMARIHEIRASLLEFKGKSGISEASYEYYEAYKLSNEPFYKFMKEFCQARIDNKSFCQLVSNWKEIEKEGIFLDYYDYTVFECHLESALKKSIFRKDELELARQKLEEISIRTQSKIMKDRVSAYIFLMNSLDFCFEQGSYEDAAENVRKACKIFREFDDKQGCGMCECFYEALLENRNPESWRNVVQKILLSGEFSSNFYRVLCTYSDRKRTNILENSSIQILEKTSIIEAKIDNVQNTLSQIGSVCVSIKYQIEAGFNGTDAELKQIKGKIDNIQHDLDNLVRISNNIGGKEGECIREFASRILDLIKKEDYEALDRFSEKVVQNSSSITEIIESAKIPEKEKEEAKLNLSDFKKIPEILKEKAKSFSVDIARDVVVSLTAEEIVKLLVPVLSTAVFGVPIPSQILATLLAAIRTP
jgi:hypothetical protein